MALQTVLGGLVLPEPPLAITTAPNFSTHVIDATDEKSASIFRVPKSGEVNAILWRTATVTTGGTVDVRLETVDATTGDPSGTLKDTLSNGAQAVLATDDNIVFITSLTQTATVVEGDIVACVIVRDAVAGNMQIAQFADESTHFPYPDLFTAAWAKSGDGPVMAVRYDDGSYAPVRGVWPVSLLNSVTFNNTSTPDVRGLHFQLPFPCRVTGAWVWCDLDGDADLKLWDSDGTTVLETASLDTNIRRGTSPGFFWAKYAGTSTLLANTAYRLGLEPTSATNVDLYDFDVAAAAVMDAFPGGQNFRYTSAKNPAAEGDWTQVTTKRPFMGLILDQFDDGAGGAIHVAIQQPSIILPTRHASY